MRIILSIAALCLLAATPAWANTNHLTQFAYAQGIGRDTAHDNAHAQADGIMRIACVAVGGTLQNEVEDSASYAFFGRDLWGANVLLEADCVTND